VARALERLDFDVVLCDPPRQEAELGSEQNFVSLADALKCDVVTLHTPLTRSGGHATYHMLPDQELAGLGAEQLLINAGRGEVIDSAALIRRLEQCDAPLVALDVWEYEPRISPELVDLVWLATPHTAGYSLEGKMQGTDMVIQALGRFLGLPVRKKASQYLPEPPRRKISITSNAAEDDAIRLALPACYDPRRDDLRLRLAMNGGQ